MKNTILLVFTCVGLIRANAYQLQTETTSDSSPIVNVQIIPKVDLHAKGALTFFWGNGSSAIQDQVAKTLKENLKFNFPDVETQIDGPNAIGYQYHVKDKVSIGMVYSNSSITTSKFTMPNFQSPADSSVYYYKVGMNSLLMQIDWFWGKIKRPKSTWSFHSGLGLGVFSFNLTTEIEKGTGAGIDQVNNSVSTSGFQLTAVGVKHTMNALRGFGWFANLGVGVNSVGFTTGVNYTL